MPRTETLGLVSCISAPRVDPAGRVTQAADRIIPRATGGNEPNGGTLVPYGP